MAARHERHLGITQTTLRSSSKGVGRAICPVPSILAGSPSYLSRITVAEIRFGIERIPSEDPFRAELEAWLENGLRRWFAGRILDIDEEVILAWRRLVETGRSDNYTFAQPDLFIAAVAAVHQLCVVTRNVEDFVKARVLVLNPWTDRMPRGAA